MKLSVASMALSALLATPVAAQDLDFSKISCKDFVSSPKDQIGTILVWLEGYYTKENAPPIMYEAKTVKDGKALGEYCAAHGDDDIVKAAEAVIPVK